MTGLWTYPWCFSSDRFESTLDSLADAGIDHLKVAAHYHSVRTFNPKAGDLGFETFPGGCLFDPDVTDFQRTPICPPKTDDYGRDDAFDDIVSAASSRDFGVDAWVVCLHGTRLADRQPEFQIEDAFGDAHAHSLCPSHPEVRAYFAGVVSNVSRYDVDRIDLESIGFPSVFHDHGPSFGHHKDHVVTNRASEFLVSQCFCNGCQRAAEGRIDLAAARDVVTRLCRRYLTQPNEEMPPLSELVRDYPMLNELFEFREEIVEKLLAELSAASDGTPLSYYLADGGGYMPGELWPAGVTPTLLSQYVDDVTVLCYTDNPETIDGRIEACQTSLEHELDAGLTLDPDVVEDRDHWNRLSRRVADSIDGDLFVYNYDLMTEAHLEWIAPNDTKPHA